MPLVAERLGDQRAGHHRQRQADGESQHRRIEIEMRGERAQRIGPFRDEGGEVDVADRGPRRRRRSTAPSPGAGRGRAPERDAASQRRAPRARPGPSPRWLRAASSSRLSASIASWWSGGSVGMAGRQELEAQVFEIERARRATPRRFARAAVPPPASSGSARRRIARRPARRTRRAGRRSWRRGAGALPYRPAGRAKARAPTAIARRAPPAGGSPRRKPPSRSWSGSNMAATARR